ncbi:MAG TPA: universal stress protein [Microbacterium sp.]|nr:universal stress protein [Microbacterium sp.]
MSSTIVVGITGGSATSRAADWAVARAAARGQSVQLLGVVGGAVGAVGEGPVVESAIAATQEILDAEAARFADSGVPLTSRVAVGDPVAALIAASKDAALIVLGSDYRGDGSGPARGSHGIRVVAGSSCPVAVVPDIDLADRRGVVVGVDGSPVSDAAIAFAAAEAERLGEPLIAVCVWTPVASPRHSQMVFPEQYRASMNEISRETLAVALEVVRAQHPHLEIEEHVAEGYPSTIINQFAADARLTVVGSRGRGAVRRFLLGSISHEVLQRLATVTAVVR